MCERVFQTVWWTSISAVWPTCPACVGQTTQRGEVASRSLLRSRPTCSLSPVSGPLTQTHFFCHQSRRCQLSPSAGDSCTTQLHLYYLIFLSQGSNLMVMIILQLQDLLLQNMVVVHTEVIVFIFMLLLAASKRVIFLFFSYKDANLLLTYILATLIIPKLGTFLVITAGYLIFTQSMKSHTNLPLDIKQSIKITNK